MGFAAVMLDLDLAGWVGLGCSDTVLDTDLTVTNFKKSLEKNMKDKIYRYP